MNMMSTMKYDGAQNSGVIGVRSVTQRLLVKAPLWSLDVVMLCPSRENFMYIVSVHQAVNGNWLTLGVNLQDW